MSLHPDRRARNFARVARGKGNPEAVLAPSCSANVIAASRSGVSGNLLSKRVIVSAHFGAAESTRIKCEMCSGCQAAYAMLRKPPHDAEET
jgi:hypothetical protein